MTYARKEQFPGLSLCCDLVESMARRRWTQKTFMQRRYEWGKSNSLVHCRLMSVSHCRYTMLLCFTVRSASRTVWEWTQREGFWPGIYKLLFWDSIFFTYFLAYLFFVYGIYFHFQWGYSSTLLLLVFLSITIGKLLGKVSYRIDVYPHGICRVAAALFFSSVLAWFGSECWLSVLISNHIGSWLWLYCICTRPWWCWLVCVFVHWQHFYLPCTQSSGLLRAILQERIGPVL